MTEPDVDARLAVARDHLTEKLTELHRRQTAVVTALSPLRHLSNPWLGVGIAVVLGYRLGRRARAVAPAAPASLVGSPSVVRSIVRASAIVVAETLARRVVTRWSERLTGD